MMNRSGKGFGQLMIERRFLWFDDGHNFLLT